MENIMITAPSIVAGLRQLGVRPGMTLLSHCSLSSFGHVYGGPQAIVEALIECVGPKGTLVMPSFTEGRFDPSEWNNPPVEEKHWDRIRFETPLYNPNKTPTDKTMSSVYELFRTWPNTKRTNHPHSSFSAWGHHRDKITKEHCLDCRFGESSPLAKLYDLNAFVLFLGTSYLTNTSFHLAEYRQRNPPMRNYHIVQQVRNVKKCIEYTDVDTNSSIFQTIGDAFEKDKQVLQGIIGESSCRLFEMPGAVNYAQDWLNMKNRSLV
jgi:aminoglycoside 3-N-acetyltransferase